MLSPNNAVRLLSLAGLVEEAPLAFGENEKFAVLGMLSAATTEEKETMVAIMRRALSEMTVLVDDFEGA